MAEQKSDKPKWFLLPTPDPSLFGIRVVVPMNIIVNNASGWPQEGSLLSENPWVADAVLRDPDLYGNYIYTDNEATTSSERESSITFIYGPPRTEEQKQEPYREFPSHGNHYWPPMLLMLKFIPDRNFPITTQGSNGQMVIGYRHYVREVFIPGANEGSLFITRKFYSPTKFDIGQHPVPEPTAVSYDYLGARGSFPECLHGRIRIPAMRTAFATYSTGSGSAGASGVLAGQIFPETNFIEWAPYVLRDSQEFVSVGWERTQVEVFPPPLPETIIR